MNHKAIVATVTQTIEIPGADKIQVSVVLGENCITRKNVKIGDIGILFPEGLQLSEEYCHQNNLFRKSEKNKDNTQQGFFEESRRVRAQPFLKVRSSAYFASLESIAYACGGLFGDSDIFKIGNSFDEFNGHAICCKYVSQATKDKINNVNKPKQAKKTLAPYFEKHVDSAQFKHSAAMIPKGALIHYHAKIHGTSHRSAHTKISVELPRWKQWVNKVVPELFQDWKWDYVVGTRNTVLTPNKEGFHGSEQFRFDVAEMLKPYVQKGMSVYGEIAGYANGKPIMAVHNSKAVKDKAFTKKYGDNIIYKYGCKTHEYRFHVYRITYLNHEGINIDFTEAQLKQWCADRGILHTLDVAPPEVYDGDVEKLLAKVEALTERTALLSEDFIDPSQPSEGVILRIDTGKPNPYFLKSKAYPFRCMESLCEAVDREEVEANTK